MNLSGAFSQGPSEVKRYNMDYAAQLSSGETITGMVFNIFSTTIFTAPPFDLVVNNVAISPDGTQVVFYVSGGSDGNVYQIQFLATTSLAQTWEDVVQVTVQEKLD